jgi:MFS family permease
MCDSNNLKIRGTEIGMERKIFTRDFTLGFLGRLTFQSAHHILIPTLPIYLARLGSEEAEIGILIGVFGVSSLALRPFIGRALLKHSEKNIMIAGTLFFAFAAIAYFLARPFWPFLTVRFVQGMGFAFYSTASFVFIANISQPARLGQSLSYFFLAPNLSLALIPALGIFIINHFSFNVLFLVCLSLTLASLFITASLGKREVVPSKASSTEEGPLLCWKALPPSIVGFFSHLVWGAVSAFFPLYAVNQGVNPGFFFTALAIMLILGRALGGKILDQYSRERVILYCLITPVLSMGVLSCSKTQPLFILVAALWGAGHAFLTPSLMAYTLESTGSLRGPAIGTFTAISDFGQLLGPMVMGIVIRWTSYRMMFSCLALICLVSLAYFYYFVRKAERERRQGLSS